jgi:hypothetical protein
MQKYTSKQYNTVFYKLPNEIQDIVASSQTTETLRRIGAKHKLQLDMIGNLINIVLDTLMGIIASRDITNEIVENCQLSRVEASMLVKDLDEELFKPIKELMVRIYADGAPFKPATLQTIDETEEDHMNLDKTDILKEIEDPQTDESSRFKVESKKLEIKNISYKPSTTKTVEEYHTEISLGKKMDTVREPQKTIFRENSPTGISNIEESKKRLLDSIASQKLSGVFTMPRISNDEISSIPPKVVPQNTEAPKADEVKNNVSGDPYREATR